MFKKNKKAANPYAPRPYRPPTPRDIIRRAFRSAGAPEALPPIRKTPTDLQRLVSAAGLSEEIAGNLSAAEADRLEADLSGLAAGRVAGTLPERLVAAWMVKNGYEYGGMEWEIDLSKDWFFQYPLFGGRYGGGVVADVFVSPQASATDKGMVIRVNGFYWHSGAIKEAGDVGQKLRLEGAGYQVRDIWDYEVEQPGILDGRMREWLGGPKI